MKRFAVTLALLMALPGVATLVVTILHDRHSVSGVADLLVQTLVTQVATSLAVMGALALVGLAFGKGSLLWMIMGSMIGAFLLMTAWLDSVASSPFADALDVVAVWFGWVLFGYYVIVLWPWMDKWRRRRPTALPPG